MLTPAGSSRGRSTKRDKQPQLSFHVPAYGLLYITHNPSRLESYADLPPENENLAGPSQGQLPVCRGELEVMIPGDMVRCKSIRISFRTILRLAMGPERGWEEDVIAERSLDMEEPDGIVLHAGINR